MIKLGVVILAYNEEIHIGRAISSVARVASEIFVIDSGSTDNTVDIAKDLGASVVYHPFENQARQLQWALENVPIDCEWIMRLDADEIIEPALERELLQRLPMVPSNVAGINLLYKARFMGRLIRFGGRQPIRILRIWRKGRGFVEDRWMDEHMWVDGSVISFHSGFVDWNLKGLDFFIEKHNRYATREALEVIICRRKLLNRNDDLCFARASVQAVWKRAMKEKLFNRLPSTVGPFLYFVWRYIFRLGFLDGREGFAYHFLQGWWYRFLVGAKVTEMEREVAHLGDSVDILEKLSALTGHSLVMGRQAVNTYRVANNGKKGGT